MTKRADLRARRCPRETPDTRWGTEGSGGRGGGVRGPQPGNVQTPVWEGGREPCGAGVGDGPGVGKRPTRALRAARAPPAPPPEPARPQAAAARRAGRGEGRARPPPGSPGARPLRLGDRKDTRSGARLRAALGAGPEPPGRVSRGPALHNGGGWDRRPGGAGCPGARRGSWRRGTRSRAGSAAASAPRPRFAPGARARRRPGASRPGVREPQPGACRRGRPVPASGASRGGDQTMRPVPAPETAQPIGACGRAL